MKFEELETKVIVWGMERKIIPTATPEMQLTKTMSELGQLANATANRDMAGMANGLGGIITSLIIYAELQGLDVVPCLELAYNTIKDRKGVTLPDGVFVKA